MKLKSKLLIFSIYVLVSSTKINAQESSEKIQDWASYSQSLDVSDKVGYEFRISADIRTENTKKKSKAALWARVDKKDKKVGFFQNDAATTNTSREWKTFEIKGVIDKDATVLNIGAFCQNTGDFYFDNFKVEVKKGKQKWKAIAISNPNFEDKSSKEDLWKNGIGRNQIVTVKNFTTEYSSNNPSNGNKCLLIQCKNILGSNDSGKFIDVNDVSLYYEIYGEGEPLLLLHGNGQSMSSFINQVEEYSKYYKVILVDCRGRGNSTYQKGVELTFDLQIDDIKLFLDKLNIEKTHIVGWSDGGIIGLLMAIKYPEKVNKLVATGANIFPDGIADLDGMKKTVLDLEKDNLEHKNDLVINLYNLDIKYPNLEYADLGVIKSKTLIMAGDHDEIKTNHTLKMFESIPNAQLAILPNGSHYIPEENPKLFNEIVLKFLKY
jgi:pimeloyl-ACP methyl ester carboxylesterase